MEENSWNFYEYPLPSYSNKKVKIEFSVDMAVENLSDNSKQLCWQIGMEGYPIIASSTFKSGETDWKTVSGKLEVELGNTSIYLSTWGLTLSEFKIYLKNASIKVDGKEIATNGDYDDTNATRGKDDWLNVPSLKKTYVDSGIFDYVGLSVCLTGNEKLIKSKELQSGIKHHVNSVTYANDFKPQALLSYYEKTPPTHTATFTASNGKTINVPNYLPSTNSPDSGLGGVDNGLQHIKDMGIQMRGHVLTWHNQTFDWFFCKDYDISKGLLPSTEEGKAEMTARHEWYIKTLLEHINEWEKKNNNGKHVIYAWDVVNEAVADDCDDENYLRGATLYTKTPEALNWGEKKGESDSRWYQIYQSDEFILNAFRFANKYAPKDVALCYNDYNTFMPNKTAGIEKLLKSIIAHQNDSELPTRIDVMGMQGYIGKWVPISNYENAIKIFSILGLDIHITELDFGSGDSYKKTHTDYFKPLYTDYFKLFQKYAKSKPENSHGITSVSIWGWVTEDDELFKFDNGAYIAQEEFFALIDTAGKTE